MYHLRLKGEHYQMGVKRGTIFQRVNVSFPLQLGSFQLEHGTQSAKIILKTIFRLRSEDVPLQTETALILLLPLLLTERKG